MDIYLLEGMRQLPGHTPTKRIDNCGFGLLTPAHRAAMGFRMPSAGSGAT
jgi:hypothetical protein